MYLFSINRDKIAETYYSCVLLSWEGCMDLACTRLMRGNSKRLHFWKIPKQNIWLHANCGKIVSEIHRNRVFFRLTLNGEKKHFTAYCYIQPNFPPKVHFQTLPTYSYSTCYASAESREATDRQTDRQTLWPCSGSCSLPAGPWGFLSRELPRAVAEMRLLHMGSRAQSAHNQASRDIRKPKPLHSISITMSKALVVANVILQMENHEGSGPVGNRG